MQVPIYDPLVLALIAWTAAAGGVGSAVSAQRAYVQALEDQARHAVTTRQAVVARHVAEERLRIARELHDVMAHHIAAINVHAGSAEAHLPASAEHSRQALVLIRRASSGALEDLQGILHLLRTDGDRPHSPNTDIGTGTDTATAEVTSPTPGTRHISALIASFAQLGLEIRLHGIQPQNLPDALTPAADLACYRVVQEGLTNAKRHGHGPVDVSMTVTPAQLTLRLTNTPKSPTHQSGPVRDHFGLIGMQERVSSAGGQLIISDTPTSFDLTATFPQGPPP